MLDVTFYRDSRDRCPRFCYRHAEFAEHGEDIVCAAVSAILQSARLGLESYARIPLDVRQESGTMRLHWPESPATTRQLPRSPDLRSSPSRASPRNYPEHVKFSRARDEG